jgi:hypothetical protein
MSYQYDFSFIKLENNSVIENSQLWPCKGAFISHFLWHAYGECHSFFENEFQGGIRKHEDIKEQNITYGN